MGGNGNAGGREKLPPFEGRDVLVEYVLRPLAGVFAETIFALGIVSRWLFAIPHPAGRLTSKVGDK